MSKVLKIGTRKSELALAQTNLVKQSILQKFPDFQIEIVHAVTQGDSKQGTPAAAFSDKRDWISGLEEMLLAEEVDIAIHSAKDVPIVILEGTDILPILERAPFQDIFIGKNCSKLEDLPAGAKVGTASPRRTAQVSYYRSDLGIAPLRGNITTRISKLTDGEEYDGIILAAAGIERLKCYDGDIQKLPTEVMLPCVNQGQLAAQFREGDTQVKTILESLSNENTRVCFSSEREVISGLGADCSSAVGVLSTISDGKISITAKVYGIENNSYICIESSRQGGMDQAIALATDLFNELLSKGAGKHL